MNSYHPPLIVLVGPTAVGKTQTAIQLAEQLNGEIVSADSRLFYRGMDIGTAKPSLEDRARIPHHLIDVADPDQTWSLTVFQKEARQAIAGIHDKQRLPFLVGGTGQYIRAVTKGWTPPRVGPDINLRTVLENLTLEHGKNWLHAKLILLDPHAAEKIDPRNVRRTIRALEVIFSTGRLFSEQKGQIHSPYALLEVGLIRPRKELYQRVDARIDAMFEQGLLDEVRGLLSMGYTAEFPTMSAIGYRECVKVLERKITEEQAKLEMRKATRVFIRRQANWFKENDPEIRWFAAGNTSTIDIANYIANWLSDLNQLSRHD
jgi:tRNA dimethylallyltransferase